MWRHPISELQRRHRQFDETLTARLQDYAAGGGRSYCKAGCHNCCNLTVNATFIEALAIAQGLSEAQGQRLRRHVPRLLEVVAAAGNLKDFLRLHRQTLGFCPLLETDGRCGIYPLRPFACRALLSTRDPAWCAVDFSLLHPMEKQAFLSSLDPALVSFPSHYLAFAQELGAELERTTTEAMAATCGMALSGNLTVLLWLEAEQHLSSVIPHGAAAVADLLRATGTDHPLLLELQLAPSPPTR